MPKFQKILHPEKFNLILYYAITSICCISASALRPAGTTKTVSLSELDALLQKALE
ncbi:MAG: hypothetical protein AABY38_07690 [Planctomycetota bacterium]